MRRLRLSNWAKAPAMNTTRAKLAQGVDMKLGAIALMPRKAIARKVMVHSYHACVALDLCKDACHRNDIDQCIAPNDRALLNAWLHGGQRAVAVDVEQLWGDGKGAHGAGHGLQAGVEDVELVDFAGGAAAVGEDEGRVGAQDGGESGAAGRGKALGVGEVRERGRGQQRV